MSNRKKIVNNTKDAGIFRRTANTTKKVNIGASRRRGGRRF